MYEIFSDRGQARNARPRPIRVWFPHLLWIRCSQCENRGPPKHQIFMKLYFSNLKLCSPGYQLRPCITGGRRWRNPGSFCRILILLSLGWL